MTDALGLVGSCLEYMSRLHDPAIFKFCAIPQVGGWAGGWVDGRMTPAQRGACPAT